MATDFEIFVNTELPKRISTNDDPLEVVPGTIPVSTGMGLETTFKTAEELSLYGKSAYQLAQEDGFEGTQEEWLESLKGEQGIQGEDGKSAYTVAVDEGYSGTVEEWLQTLNGKSAYQTWLDLGNDGTEAAFIASLKGIAGENGTGVNILGNITQEEFDVIVEEDLSNVGDGWLVEEFIYIFNGDFWVKSNPLQGPEGKGLNYLGTWPNAIELPLGDNYTAGDTYIWRNSLWTLSITPERAWIDIGVPGPVGKSAYQSWLDIGNVGTEVAFIESLKGDVGPEGKSSYQVWLELPGNAGKTEVEYFDSLKGNKGDMGEPAVAFTIGGRLSDASELPRPGDSTIAYYVGNDLYIWIETQSDYDNFGSINGMSAYQEWLAVGNEGTVEDFLDSLKGTNGTNGTNGQSTYQLWVLQPGNEGKSETEFLETINGTNGQSTYQLWVEQPGNEGKSEVEFLTSLKGTNGIDGTDGTNGKSTYQIWLDDGNEGSEVEFLESLKGVDGTDGTNLQVNGTKPTSAEIEDIIEPVNQEAWVAVDTGHLWIYNGSQWVDAGQFRGKSSYQVWLDQGNEGNAEDFLTSLKGTNGTNGTNGQSTYQLWLEAGNEGTEAEFLVSLKGVDGEDGQSTYALWLEEGNVGTELEFLESLKGENGQNGRNVVITGSVPSEVDLPEDAVEQAAYTVQDTGHLWMYIQGVWTDLGEFRGPQGEEGPVGPTGQGINILGEVELSSELPPAATLNTGDAYYVSEDGKLYQVNDQGSYNPGIEIRGFQGDPGIQGVPGPAGTSITISGSYLNESDLIAAHPTGVPGEGYLIGDDLYLYGIDPTDPGQETWYNAGPVRGPQGIQGIQGIRGLRGLTGDKGERGSLWLTLPAGVSVPPANYGTEGDWAVNSQFDTFYRDPLQGWVLTGRIVAGDVNSPLPILGKVVREGAAWVALPVDEVPAPQIGVQYVRVGIDGNKTEWAEIDVIADVAPDTEIPQGRTSNGWVPIAPTTEGVEDNARYVLFNNTWTKSAIQTSPPSTPSVAYCYQVNAQGVGSWVLPRFNTYNLLQSSTAETTNFTPIWDNQQTYRISGSGSSPVTVTLTAGQANRSMVAVFVVEGSSQKPLFIGANGSTVSFNNGGSALDIEYGATITVLTAFWTGFGNWIISKGPSF